MYFALPLPRRPRSPLARVLSFLVGLAVLGLLLISGLIVAGVLLVGGLVWLALRHWRKPRQAATGPAAAGAARREVIEGEYVVIHERH